MPNRNSRHWTAEEKLRILGEGRQAHQGLTEVCRCHQIIPGQFYLWEKQEAARGRRRTERGESPAEKRAVAVASRRRYSP